MNSNRNEFTSVTPRLASFEASDRIAPPASSPPPQFGKTSLGNFPRPLQKSQGKEISAHPSQRQDSSSHVDEAKHEPNKKIAPFSHAQPEDLSIISIVDSIAPIPVTKPEKKVPERVAGQEVKDLQTPHAPKREDSSSSDTCCMTQEDASGSDGTQVSCFSGSLNDFDGTPSTYRISHEKCFTKYAEDHLLHLLDDNEHEGRVSIQRNTCSTNTYRLSHEIGHLSFASSLSIDMEDDDSTDVTVSSLSEDDESSLAESLNDDHQGSHRGEDLQESSRIINRYRVSYERSHLSLANDLLQGLDDEEDSVGGTI